MELSLEVPINGLSFGQTAINILHELFSRGVEPNILPIGNSGDVSSYDLSPEFKGWLERCIAKAAGAHKRSTPTLKLWHLNGALSSYSDRRALFTFHETDRLTPFEANAVENNDVVFVSSRYTQAVMGTKNVVYCPLGFDSNSFFETHKRYFGDDVICFGIGGKFEKRKHHGKVLRAWAKRYGNNPRYRLNAALTNTHLDNPTMNGLIGQALEGKAYRNINFLPYMKANRDYNEFLNANSIYLAMSGGEGFDLPAFQSVALGKHVVALDAHVYQDYLTHENAVLVAPNGMEPVYDGIFFHEGQPYNQGNIFTFDEDAFIAGCEAAEARFLASKVNRPGKKLQQEFTYAKTVDTILANL